MKKTTLIAPFDDPLARAVAAEARIFGRTVAPLLPGSGKAASDKRAPEAADAGTGEPTVNPVPWNPPSYVSARAAVLEASLRFGAADEAVLVSSRTPAPGLSARPAEIEQALHDRVLGIFWLVRELLSAFKERPAEKGPGRLVLVLADRGREALGPVEAAAFGALEAFASSLAGTSGDTPYEVWSVQDSCPQDDLAAQYIAKLLEAGADRRAGRVVKFTGKGGIFNRI